MGVETLVGAVIAGASAYSTGIGLLGIGAGIGAFFAGAAITVGLSFVGKALQPSVGKTGSAGFSQSGLTTTIKEPLPSRKTIYGEGRFGGSIVFATTTDNGNYLHLLIAFCSHEVESIETIFFDEKPLQFDSSGQGEVTGGYYTGAARILKYLGKPDQLASSALVSEVNEWTSADRLQEEAYIYARLKWINTASGTAVYSGGIPQISAWIKGKKVYDPRTEATYWTANAALIARDYLTSTRLGKGIPLTSIDDSYFISAANVCDQQVVTKATTDGLSSRSVRQFESAGGTRISLNGATIPFLTGDRVQLSTTGALPSGLTVSPTNYYIIVQDFGNSYVELAETFDDAIMGNAITYGTGASGTASMRKRAEPRYTINGRVECTEQPFSIVNNMADAMAGSIFEIGGKWICYAGAYQTPTISYDLGDTVGKIEFPTRYSKKDRFNAVKGKYLNPAYFSEPENYPVVIIDQFVNADNGVIRYADLDLPFTARASSAQRIAKIKLERQRREIIVSATLNMTGMLSQIGDTVELTVPELGWTDKTFEIIEWSYSRNKDTVLIPVVLRETDANIYDWDGDTNETTINETGETDLDSPFDTLPPTGLTLASDESQILTLGNGTLINRIKVDWSASPSPFIANYEVQFKLSSAAAYQINELTSTETLTSYISNVTEGVNYDVRVRAINTIGVKSEWLTRTNYTVIGKTSLPANITGFFVNDINNQAHLIWDKSTDSDVRTGGSIRLRYTPLTTGATWSNAIDISPLLAGSSTSATVPLLSGTYMIKAIDSGGRESVSATAITTDTNYLFDLTTIVTSAQHPDFSGTKTNMLVIDGELRLEGAILFDDLSGDFDDASGYFDGGGGAGFELSGSYEFDNYIDLGDVYQSEVTIDIKMLIENTSETFDEQSGLFDDRGGFFDGDDITDVAVENFVSTTNDDPAGTPTWSDWRKFYAGDFTCRAYKFKTEVTSLNSALNCRIQELTAKVRVPLRQERFSDFALSAAGNTITFSKPFFGDVNIAVTIQNGATGDYYTVTSKTASSAFVRAFNSAGTGVARTVDILVSSY